MIDIKNYTDEGEREYAPIPESGEHTDLNTTLSDIIPKLKPFSVRKPVAYIVGSLIGKNKLFRHKLI